MVLKNGQLLQQHRYRIAKRLGEGGMGAVYRAWDARLKIPIALKEMIPQPDLESDRLDQLRQQFRQEATVLARLHHPNLVRVTDFFEERGIGYLVMDFVDGVSLAEHIHQKGALPESQVLTWAEELLDALAYCHSEGILHRDIKPQNVIIRPDGHAVLVDFGLVKLWDPNDPKTKTAMRGMGTPEYAPPEHYDINTGITDPSSDIYSLGATLYHALTGRAPPTATLRIADPERLITPRSIEARISRKTEQAILISLELSCSRRWQTAGEMAQALSIAVPQWKPSNNSVEAGEATNTTKNPQISGALTAAMVQHEKSKQPWGWILVGLFIVSIACLGLFWIMPGLWFTSPIPSPDVPDLEETLVYLIYRGRPYLIGLIAVGTLLLSGISILSYHSGLPLSFLICQNIKTLQVAWRYPSYYHRWRSLRPLARLIVLMDVEKIEVHSMTHRLRELHIPVTEDQVGGAMDSAVRQGLLRQDDVYHWAEPPLLELLREQVGSSHSKLADEIRRDNLLFQKTERFLRKSEVNFELIRDTSIYRCQLPTGLQRRLPKTTEAVYAWVMPGERLDGDRVLSIQNQIRAFQITKALVLVITDQRPTDQGWAQIGTLRMEGLIILPIESSLINEGLIQNSAHMLLRQEIEHRLGTKYDPYDVRDPVSEAFSFFGRGPLVETLLRQMKAGDPVGIFALRKLGKSSLLLTLRDRTLFPVALVNLQTVGDTELNEMYGRILRYWKQWTRVRYALRTHIPTITSEDPTGSFVAATLSLLEQLEKHQVEARLGLFLDEIELIVPRPGKNRPSLTRYLTLMRAIRGLIDEDGRLSLVVASLNNSLNRINRWDEEQNPTFNFFQEIYLPPLAKDDCIHMVRNIGRQIGLVYDHESVQAIIKLSGGHPFLARQLCSLLYKQRDYQPGEITIHAISASVERFIYDEKMVAHVDAGIWQDANNPSLWGEAQAKANQELLLALARADKPPAKEILVRAPNADIRHTALINLERFHFIYQPEPGYYALRYGLLHEWLRRRKLGLE